MLSAHIDMLAGDAEALVEALKEAGLQVIEADLSGTRQVPEDADALCQLAIRCLNDEPEVSRVIPAVPG